MASVRVQKFPSTLLAMEIVALSRLVVYQSLPSNCAVESIEMGNVVDGDEVRVAPRRIKAHIPTIIVTAEDAISLKERATNARGNLLTHMSAMAKPYNGPVRRWHA